MTSIEKYFEMQDELKEKGYAFKTDEFESMKEEENIKFPCYFIGDTKYNDCFVLVSVMENGCITVIKQNRVQDVVEVEIRSTHDKFLADKAIKNHRYAFNNIYTDLKPINDNTFEAYRNKALFNLTEVNLNPNKKDS